MKNSKTNCVDCNKPLGSSDVRCHDCIGDETMTLEEAREVGTTLVKARVGCSAYRWQTQILPYDTINWDQMGTYQRS